MTQTHSHIMPTYGRLPVSFTHGEGSWLVDEHGKRYLDALTGIAVCGLGHAHPAVTQAVIEQAQKFVHCSNLYHIEQQEQLATKLCQRSQMDNAFFANSGAEANECAIKLARFYGNQQGKASPTIITTSRSFHGRTMATLTATGNPKVKVGFTPLLEGFIEVPFNDVAAIEAHSHNENVCAIMVEPVQGEGGINIPDADYLDQLRALCDANNWLLILDEVQSGNGRSGHLFAFQKSGILPDILTTAKGLGNGYPIGACLARGLAATLFQPGNHGSTYGGNPVVCAAANAVIDTLDEAFLAQVTQRSDALATALHEKLKGKQGFVHVRHMGMLIGIEFDHDISALVQQALEAGLLINVTQQNTIRLLPPLNISEQDSDILVEKLAALLP